MTNIVFSPALQAPITLSNPAGSISIASDPSPSNHQANPIPNQGAVSLVGAAVRLALAMAANTGSLVASAAAPKVVSGLVTPRQPTVGTLATAGAAPTMAVGSSTVLTFPRVMLCGVGGDQSYGSNSSTGFPAWTTAAAGSAANAAVQSIGAYDIAVIAGVFEGWDSSGSRDRENLTKALGKSATTYVTTKNNNRATLVFYYEIMNVTVAGNPYAQWQALVSANNWFLYPQPAGGGTATSFINYSSAWPGAIGNAGVGASICGSNYGTTSSGSPTGAQGPARTFGNYAAIKLLMRGYTGDSRFSFNPQMGSPSAAGIFLDECFVAIDGDASTGSASLDGVTIAPGSQQGGGFPGLDTVQPVMARGNRNMFDQMQTMLALVNPGKVYYNFANFGQYANKYQFGTATLTCGLENTLHGGLIENVIGSGASALECFQRGNFSNPGTPYPSGALNILDIYYQGMDFCLAPKMVGVGVKLPSADGTITSSWPVGAGTTLTTVTAGTAFEYQLLRYGLAFSLMDDGYFAPGCTGYDWSKPRWYDEYGDDSLTQVNVKRGYLGTPLTTRPTTPQWALGPMGVWWRAFSNGGVAWNPRGNGAQSITLPRQYQALTGTQQPTINNGALVTSLTIPDGDGRIFILPTSAQAWTFSDLITSWIGQNNPNAGLQKVDDGGTGNGVVWTSDSTGPYLKYTSVKPGTCGLRYTVPTTGLHEICVQYDIRRHSNLASKQCKTYGWGQANSGPATSNATFGPTMGGYAGTSYGVYYGDVSTGSNDVSVAYATSGYPTTNLPAIGFGSGFSRTPYPTQATKVAATQDITGAVWETWMVYFKAASPSTPDGEIAIWKNGILVMHMTNLWNDNDKTQDRGGFALYEYSSNSGFQEDYRKVFAMFARPVGMGI